MCPHSHHSFASYSLIFVLIFGHHHSPSNLAESQFNLLSSTAGPKTLIRSRRNMGRCFIQGGGISAK